MDLMLQDDREHPELSLHLHRAARRDRAIAIARVATVLADRAVAKVRAIRSACAAMAFSQLRWG